MDAPSRPPATYREFVARFPALGAAHESAAEAVAAAGPLDAKARALIKIGISLGAGLDSALRSHVRQALHAGATEAEIEQAVLLAFNTLGFPRTVAGWSWARQQIERGA